MEGHLGLVLASAAVMASPASGVPNLLVNRVLPENGALLLQGLAIVLVVVAGVAAAQYLQTMMMLRIESITDLRLQTAVFDRVMRLPMRFVRNTPLVTCHRASTPSVNCVNCWAAPSFPRCFRPCSAPVTSC